MRASALQILREEEASKLIPAHDGWNPLDDVAAPEFVPEHWIGAHVGLRLVEAFKTLALLPGVPGPRIFGNSWPLYAFDWSDLLAQETAERDAKEARAAESNRVRLQPSARDVGRMEVALLWPGHYLASRPLILRMVQSVALWRARGLELDRIARRLKKPAATVRRQNRDGLDAIAAGLHRDWVAVF
jgi:hypothetical protein